VSQFAGLVDPPLRYGAADPSDAAHAFLPKMSSAAPRHDDGGPGDEVFKAPLEGFLSLYEWLAGSPGVDPRLRQDSRDHADFGRDLAAELTGLRIPNEGFGLNVTLAGYLALIRSVGLAQLRAMDDPWAMPEDYLAVAPTVPLGQVFAALPGELQVILSDNQALIMRRLADDALDQFASLADEELPRPQLPGLSDPAPEQVLDGTAVPLVIAPLGIVAQAMLSQWSRGVRRALEPGHPDFSGLNSAPMRIDIGELQDRLAALAAENGGPLHLLPGFAELPEPEQAVRAVGYLAAAVYPEFSLAELDDMRRFAIKATDGQPAIADWASLVKFAREVRGDAPSAVPKPVHPSQIRVTADFIADHPEETTAAGLRAVMTHAVLEALRWEVPVDEVTVRWSPVLVQGLMQRLAELAGDEGLGALAKRVISPSVQWRARQALWDAAHVATQIMDEQITESDLIAVHRALELAKPDYDPSFHGWSGLEDLARQIFGPGDPLQHFADLVELIRAMDRQVTLDDLRRQVMGIDPPASPAAGRLATAWRADKPYTHVLLETIFDGVTDDQVRAIQRLDDLRAPVDQRLSFGDLLTLADELRGPDRPRPAHTNADVDDVRSLVQLVMGLDDTALTGQRIKETWSPPAEPGPQRLLEIVYGSGSAESRSQSHLGVAQDLFAVAGELADSNSAWDRLRALSLALLGGEPVMQVHLGLLINMARDVDAADLSLEGLHRLVAGIEPAPNRATMLLNRERRQRLAEKYAATLEPLTGAEAAEMLDLIEVAAAVYGPSREPAPEELTALEAIMKAPETEGGMPARTWEELEMLVADLNWDDGSIAGDDALAEFTELAGDNDTPSSKVDQIKSLIERVAAVLRQQRSKKITLGQLRLWLRRPSGASIRAYDQRDPGPLTPPGLFPDVRSKLAVEPEWDPFRAVR
jgi:hypothetical protein